jgi:uncharacterized membrane protein YebE (DUF533 family)
MPAARVTPPEALIYAMVTVSAADRAITSEEITRIGSVVRDLPAFETYGDDWLAVAAQDCGKILKKPMGVDKVLAIVKTSLPPALHETAYVLVAEIAASDLSVTPDEEHFMSLLAAALGLDKLTCAALERAARARHQRV